MATVKTNLGKIPCPSCGDPVALYKSETGKLSYTCQHPDCESTGYASPHTGAAKKWLSQLPKAAASTDPAPVKTPAPPAAKPAPKANNFSIGEL